MKKERIDKILAHEGLGSRKDIRKILRKYEVLVNGNRVYDAGFAIDCDADTITIDGEEINLHTNVYLMMNKIAHTISSNKDGEHQTVFDLLDDSYHTPYLQEKLHLIGRLDMDTEGLLLFTTDGELTHRIISPKNHINKTYFVILRDELDDTKRSEIEQKFADGIEVGPDDNDPGFKCEAAKVVWPTVEQIETYLTNSTYTENVGNLSPEELINRCALLTIFEGKYHQVKRMFTAVDNKVEYLKRISMGSLILDKTLAAGDYKELSEEDIELLK